MKRKLSFLLIFLAVILTIWLTATPLKTPSTSSQKPTSSPLSVSWKMTQAHIWILNPKTPQTQTYLQAKAIQYQNSQKEALFQAPYIINTRPQTLTTLTSQTAHSYNDQTITFINKVIIHQLQNHTTDKNNQNKTLLSHQITYNTQTETLTSPLQVTFKQPQLTILGTGLKANLEQGNYHFDSKVRTYYVPNAPHAPKKTP